MHRILYFLCLLAGNVYGNGILQWAGDTAAPLHVSAGTIERFYLHSKYVDARNVDVWLPTGYSPKDHYPVLYLQDGQMLFDSLSTWNHQEWQVDETADRLMRTNKIRKAIIVGIWNNGAKRHAEYFPQKAFNDLPDTARQQLAKLFNGPPLADNYLKFLVTELKPFIDSAFSTAPGRQNTFIGGSSMGGLISLYALCEYPQTFGGAACISTHWPGTFTPNDAIPGAIVNYLSDHLPAPATHRIYFDHGTVGLDALYPPYQARVDTVMKKKGYGAKTLASRTFPGADHSERSWSARLDQPLIFLLR